MLEGKKIRYWLQTIPLDDGPFKNMSFQSSTIYIIALIQTVHQWIIKKKKDIQLNQLILLVV